ncbi:unnamed protein product [Miscanthus lutarioriparius]|uniref:C2H2-type domain-containing protein n=1 Tax=Miscanthus lutarioriparius TaxID=422564 RepID=A0A811N499_9POAL|nr:unnamed protein product [Miscanthus lutarioriparius]
MKRPRKEQEPAGEVSLALSLSTTDSTTTSDSTGTPSSATKRRARRRGAVALGGHRTSHLRGRHGLKLGVGARALNQHKQAAAVGNGSGGDKPPQQQQHECHICGLGFEMGQALGGHMRRHREEMGAAEAADAWVWRTEAPRAAAIDPPVLLELFA